MKFESQRGPKKRKNQKNTFYKLKRFLFFLLFFQYSFSFALQKWFLELEVASHNI
jgi:hypothetical protein